MSAGLTQAFRSWRALLLAAAMLLLSVAAAAAHPHVWIVVRSEIVYAPDGRVTALRHAWTFDEGFSAYLVQGLDANKDGKFSREELAALARENVGSLVESNYFTVAKAAGKPVEVGAPTEFWMEHDGRQLTLHYVLPMRVPAPGRTFALDVYDPSYFIQFLLADDEKAVTLVDAPKGCSVSFRRPNEKSLARTMTESFFGSQSAADYGAQFASRAIAACP